MEQERRAIKVRAVTEEEQRGGVKKNGKIHLESLKYKNIKMSRYQLSKNHWVMPIKNKTIVIVWLKISLLYQKFFSTIWRGIPLES